MAKCVLFRQNEDKQIVIYVNLPEGGLYALDFYAMKWGHKGNSCPHVATYLVASVEGARDFDPYPQISNQVSGQSEESIK